MTKKLTMAANEDCLGTENYPSASSSSQSKGEHSSEKCGDQPSMIMNAMLRNHHQCLLVCQHSLRLQLYSIDQCCCVFLLALGGEFSDTLEAKETLPDCEWTFR